MDYRLIIPFADPCACSKPNKSLPKISVQDGSSARSASPDYRTPSPPPSWTAKVQPHVIQPPPTVEIDRHISVITPYFPHPTSVDFGLIRHFRSLVDEHHLLIPVEGSGASFDFTTSGLYYISGPTDATIFNELLTNLCNTRHFSIAVEEQPLNDAFNAVKIPWSTLSRIFCPSPGLFLGSVYDLQFTLARSRGIINWPPRPAYLPAVANRPRAFIQQTPFYQPFRDSSPYHRPRPQYTPHENRSLKRRLDNNLDKRGSKNKPSKPTPLAARITPHELPLTSSINGEGSHQTPIILDQTPQESEDLGRGERNE